MKSKVLFSPETRRHASWIVMYFLMACSVWYAVGNASRYQVYVDQQRVIESQKEEIEQMKDDTVVRVSEWQKWRDETNTFRIATTKTLEETKQALAEAIRAMDEIKSKIDK